MITHHRKNRAWNVTWWAGACAILFILARCDLAGGGGSNGDGSGPVNDTQFVASCDTSPISASASGYCQEYYGTLYDQQLADLQAACARVSGGYSTTQKCNTTNELGSCKVQGTGYASIRVYYTTNFNLAAAQDDCAQQKGTFTGT